jgi:hypothetical protein
MPFIVTIYGCNSTPSDMWTPKSKLFDNYEDAYAYFLRVAPSLEDEYNAATQYINSHYNPDTICSEYTVIAFRQQTCFGNNCAKRPEGAVIARL